MYLSFKNGWSCVEFMGNIVSESTTLELLQRLKHKAEYKEAESASATMTGFDLKPVRQMVVCFLRSKQGNNRFANKF